MKNLKEKILRETRFRILEFVFRCTEERVWLSIESVKDDNKFINIASLCLRTLEFNNICDEVCEKINTIYNIKTNKVKIMNMIKLFDKNGKKLSILILSLINRSIFNNEECRFIEKINSEISLGNNLEFMQDELQYSKLKNFFIDSEAGDEVIDKIFKLIITIYNLGIQHG